MAVVGAAGSGKSSSAQHLKEQFGFEVFTPSAAIREYARAHDMPLTSRRDYALAHRAIIADNGAAYLPGRALAMETDRLVIDGLRSRRYRDVLRGAGAVVIGLECSLGVRFARVQDSDDRAKYPSTPATFAQNELDEELVELAPGMRLETEALVTEADYKIDASRPQAEVFADLDLIVERLVGERPTV